MTYNGHGEHGAGARTAAVGVVAVDSLSQLAMCTQLGRYLTSIDQRAVARLVARVSIILPPTASLSTQAAGRQVSMQWSGVRPSVYPGMVARVSIILPPTASLSTPAAYRQVFVQWSGVRPSVCTANRYSQQAAATCGWFAAARAGAGTGLPAPHTDHNCRRRCHGAAAGG